MRYLQNFSALLPDSTWSVYRITLDFGGYLCGEEFFQHRLIFDRSSLTRWRQRMGEEKLAALIQEGLSVATKTGAMKPSDLSRAIVDTTV